MFVHESPEDINNIRTINIFFQFVPQYENPGSENFDLASYFKLIRKYVDPLKTGYRQLMLYENIASPFNRQDIDFTLSEECRGIKKLLFFVSMSISRIPHVRINRRKLITRKARARASMIENEKRFLCVGLSILHESQEKR